MQKSLIQFDATIKTEATKELYYYTLDKFCDFAGIDFRTDGKTFIKKGKLKEPKRFYNYDSILELSDQQINDKLIGYIEYLKDLVKSGNLNPNSVPKYFNGIEHFLTMNDRVFNWTKLHKMFPAKKKETGKEAYTTEQIRDILSYAKSARTRFIILFLCSTGARIGALNNIKLKHIKKMKDSDCYCVTLYPDEVEEVYAFLTPEASKAYETYIEERRRDGEQFTPESPLFRTIYRLGIEKVKAATSRAIEGVVYRLLKKAVINRTKIGIRYNIQADHGFRKWYKIQIASTPDIPYEMSKKLIHHKDLEGKYNVPRPEDLFVYFHKAIPNLTIDDSARKQAEIQAKDKRIAELEARDDKIKELDRKYENLLLLLQAYPDLAKQITDFKLKQ
jgi:integrase